MKYQSQVDLILGALIEKGKVTAQDVWDVLNEFDLLPKVKFFSLNTDVSPYLSPKAFELYNNKVKSTVVEVAGPAGAEPQVKLVRFMAKELRSYEPDTIPEWHIKVLGDALNLLAKEGYWVRGTLGDAFALKIDAYKLEQIPLPVPKEDPRGPMTVPLTVPITLTDEDVKRDGQRWALCCYVVIDEEKLGVKDEDEVVAALNKFLGIEFFARAGAMCSDEWDSV